MKRQYRIISAVNQAPEQIFNNHWTEPHDVRGRDRWKSLGPRPRAEALPKPLHEAISMVEGCLSDDAQFDPASATGVFRLSTPIDLALPLFLPCTRACRGFPLMCH